ncbi:MAG: glycosyltransferase [Gammaproteobacteria bacterium]|nr:glycosyltransferase [Gammaproteobacteria bacterium]
MTKLFNLVFTVALKQEIPLEWLKQYHIPVFSIAAAKSGALKSLPLEEKRGVLFLITGVGTTKSQQAAQWIAEELNPLFTVNIGSAGATVDDKFQWVTPKWVCGEDLSQAHLEISPLPFQPKNLIPFQGVLRSTLKPYIKAEQKLSSDFNFVDMEAHAQAVVFRDHHISFSCLKYVTDSCTHGSLENYNQALENMRESCKKLLDFIKIELQPLVSIIIPIHNRPDWIRETLQSVLTQSYLNKEIIIVDDGSDTPVAEVLQENVSAIRVLRFEKNKGVSAARNAGAAIAKGAWLAFLDSDDHWAAKKLAQQIDYLHQHPYLSALQCEEIWVRNGVRVNAHKHHQKKTGWIWHHCLQRCLITPSAILIKKSVYQELGGFDERMLACEDYDLWLRLSRHFPVGLSPYQGVIKHGGHEDQLSQRHRAMDRFRIYALIKSLNNEEDHACQLALHDILIKKITILILGARKRALNDEIRAYETLLKHIKAFHTKADTIELSLEKTQWLLTNSV